MERTADRGPVHQSTAFHWTVPLARKLRCVLPDQTLHITQRGNNRMMMFTDSVDYQYLLRLMHEKSVDAGCGIHAYVLMGNHFHLLTTPTHKTGPSKMMQAIGGSYVRFFNHRQRRTGTMLEGRYRSSNIDSHRYFFACSRYIELNPVRACLSETPASYPWSSFHANSFGRADPIVTPHSLYRSLGESATEQQAAYRSLFAHHVDSVAIEAIASGAFLRGSTRVEKPKGV
ncbi:MAG: transposase [Gemmatimonadaceae bacterium]